MKTLCKVWKSKECVQVVDNTLDAIEETGKGGFHALNSLFTYR